MQDGNRTVIFSRHGRGSHGAMQRRKPMTDFCKKAVDSMEPEALAAGQKRLLRKEKIAARRAISPEKRRLADAAILQNLRTLIPSDENFSAIVGYLSDGTEPDPVPVLQEAMSRGKTICLPRFKDAEHYDLAIAETLECRNEKFGIPEPPPSAPVPSDDALKNAVWIIPGVAFDAVCHRLGRGKGVYDRLLAGRQPKLAIGIFYECQQCDSVPCSAYDVP